MEWFEALLLGLVQGLTEFLPVSSSGHLLIGKELFGIDSTDMVFEVAVHTATVLSTLVVFRREICGLVRDLFAFRYNAGTRYLCMIGVSMIPIFIVGVFFKDVVEDVFGSGLAIVGVMLLLTAALLFVSERLSIRRVSGHPLGYRDAVIMGIAQAFAVMPGLSRSGTTIAAGLISGAGRDEIARFSFLMVLVPILGEAFLSVVSGDLEGNSSVGAFSLAVGFTAAFLSGLLACRFMIAIVKKARLYWFSVYCILAAALCFVLEFA